MSYQGISVKEAIRRINSDEAGFFLPAVQRPYVWGSRHESEVYICKLFDSLLNKYPIGALILWNTSLEIPHREFVKDYSAVESAKMVDKGLFKRPGKYLVYDGQQRLQTLYSCLKYTFNDRVLCFDLLYDGNADIDNRDTTGFFFEDKNTNLSDHQIRMNELFQEEVNRKTHYRQDILGRPALLQLKPEARALIETNIDNLWDIFVKTDTKSLAYFPIETSDENEVNEIFQRLNSGGMALSQSDLLFSMIKEEHYEFEEKLQRISQQLHEMTHGYRFSSWDILQFIHLIVKGTIRVDPRKVNKADVGQFNDILTADIEETLREFFVGFIWEQFHINNNGILTSKLPLLVLLIYCYEWRKTGSSLKKLPDSNLAAMKRYFIHASLANWSLQSQIDGHSRLIRARLKDKSTAFPYVDLVSDIEAKKKRHHQLQIEHLASGGWFSLKILMPHRQFSFLDGAGTGRLKPEIDHIFPAALENQTADYYKTVNQIWNMQPVRGDINNFKRRKHPRDFFSAPDGKQYLAQYDFLPSVDVSAPVWSDLDQFIEKRKAQMINFFNNQYGFQVT